MNQISKWHLLSTLCFLAQVSLSYGQIVWHDPMGSAVPQIHNRGWNTEIEKNYHRFPERAKPLLRDAVWNLSQNSAGLYIDFYTNSKNITIKYLTENSSLPNMTAIGVSGLDLYTFNSDGSIDWCASPLSFLSANFSSGFAKGDTITIRYNDLSYHNRHDFGSEYRLFLPLYNTVKWLNIGVDSSSNFSFAPLSLEKPIVVYGTSIAQGASASRPGMAWTNILQRRFDCPVYNLGFSGNALMDDAVYDLLNELDARLYILDCMPNMYPVRDSIVARTVRGVKKLRKNHDAPILLVENCDYMYGNTYQPIRNECEVTNQQLRAAYELLRGEGIENLFYLTKEDIGLTMDDQVDGWHASDLGMVKYAEAYRKMIEQLLDYHPQPLFMPVRQRREPDTYEWNERHRQVLELNQQLNPDVVVIGNSIMHYWGGQPAHERQWGLKQWNNLFKGHRVVNMGFGWDRIENVYWRLYHGELDGISPKHIVLMIGTNNIGFQSGEQIAEGIKGLATLIGSKQPGAKLHVIKVLPRMHGEQKVKEINEQLDRILKPGPHLEVIDLTSEFTLKDGSGKIDPTLFREGLHPNEKGYAVLEKRLKSVLD